MQERTGAQFEEMASIVDSLNSTLENSADGTRKVNGGCPSNAFFRDDRGQDIDGRWNERSQQDVTAISR